MLLAQLGNVAQPTSQPASNQDTLYQRYRIFNPAPYANEYGDVDPISIFSPKIQRGDQGNADTVYYSPREVLPVLPRYVTRNPNSRMTDTQSLQRFGYDRSDLVWPSRQMLDYYMDPAGVRRDGLGRGF